VAVSQTKDNIKIGIVEMWREDVNCIEETSDCTVVGFCRLEA
jgi:hypothetical protein